MTAVLIIVAGLLGLAATGSAFAKFTKKEDVIKSVTHVGVKNEYIPLLAILEVLGALGLLAGIHSKPLGVAAATGLALYFLGAVAAHLRVKDKVKDFAPALVLFLVAVGTVLLELGRN